MEHNAGESGRINNNIDINLDVGGFDKNVDTEHNASITNSTPDVDKANNIEKEAKMCESNSF